MSEYKEGIENILVNCGRDPDLVDLVALKAKRKGFYFDPEVIRAAKENQARDDVYMRMRLDYTGDSHHIGHGTKYTYLMDRNHGVASCGSERCRIVYIFDLERALTDFANAPRPTTIKLNSDYTAVIAADRKTVKVGCSIFQADPIIALGELLKEGRKI